MAISSRPVPSYWPNPGTSYRINCECRYLPVLHRDSEILERRVGSWARRPLEAHLGGAAAEKVLRQRLALWSNLAYPRAIGDRAFWVGCQSLAFAVADDSFGSPRVRNNPVRIHELRQHFHAALEGLSPSSEFPAAQLVYQSMAGASPDMPAGVLNRLRETVGQAIDSSAAQADCPVIDTLSLNDYLRVRGDDMWGYWTAIMAEYALGVDMTEVLATNKDLARAMRLGVDAIFLVNDLFSLQKELQNGDAFNIILIFMRDDGLQLQGAIDRVVDMYNSNEHEFASICEQILASETGDRDDVKRYLKGLEDIYAGNLQYHYFSSRFHGDTAEWDGVLRHEYVVTDCAHWPAKGEGYVS